MTQSLCAFVVIILMAFSSMGCGSATDGKLPLYPVTGKVLVDGQPAGGAQITFYGAEEHLRGPGLPVPMATADENGEFSISSYGNQKGAPAGDFTVTVTWPEPTPPDADAEFYQPQDRLSGKYANRETTPLSVTVKEETNELPPFELTR